MNLLDSEYFAGIFHNLGLLKANSIDLADVVIFHTCCVRKSAENRIIGRMGEIKKLKENNKELIFGVTGCMVQQKDVARDILKKYHCVDFVLGNANICDIEKILTEKINSKKEKNRDFYSSFSADSLTLYKKDTPILRSSWPNAWINIISGCDNFCTYCIVPHVRGREISRHPLEIEDEVLSLLAANYKEITLLGQNVNRYSIDLNNGWNFNKLLKKLSSFNYEYKLSFLTSHPKNFDLDLVDTIAYNPKVSKHIHLPLQSGSDNILLAMNRNYTVSNYMEIVHAIRSKIPKASITTDIMVGFPGESKADFENTLKLIREVEFDSAYMFVYSPRKGTYATHLKQIDILEKKERITKLVEVQNKISSELSKKHIHQTYEVLVESDMKNGFYCGKTNFGRLVKFQADANLIGSFVQIEIIETKASSLIGRIMNAQTI